MKFILMILLFPYFAIGQEDLIGKILFYQVKYGETLYDIARTFDLGAEELINANPGIDPWIPKEFSELIIPSMYIIPNKLKHGIIINKAEQRLYFFSNNGKSVKTFPVSLGILGHETPLGSSVIINKQLDPYWIPPLSMRLENPSLPQVIKPGPDNPLGRYALLLSWPNILIHSTNKPWGIGDYGSHGCIRMYPEDAEVLFHLVKIGNLVKIINEHIKLGLSKGDLYIEVSSANNLDLKTIKEEIIKKYANYKINHAILEKTLRESKSIPTKITN